VHEQGTERSVIFLISISLSLKHGTLDFDLRVRHSAGILV
jgi:hypothetical protein